MRDVTVLVADDEVTVRQFFESVIRKENLPVEHLLQAGNGLDAVTLANEHQPDLVFLDVRMPGQDGLKAAKSLVQGGFFGKIVIVSAYNDFEYAREAFRIGVSDYLLKPVKPEEFSAFVLRAARVEAVNVPRNRATAPAGEKVQPALVRAVLSHIAENLGMQLRVEDIAKAVHLSPWHLSRTFKRLDGRSITECIRELRVERARDLLRDNSLSVTEIAVMVGFENAGYFATCFKQATGVSPSEFRREKGRPCSEG